MTRARTFLLALVALALAVPFGSAASAQADVPHIVVYSGTGGFRHGSIPKGNATIQSLATSSGAFTVEVTEDAAAFTPALFERADIILFNNTTGETPFTPEQKQQFVDFMLAGGGFMGIHAATDTNYQWPEYQEMIGATFESHPHTGAGLFGTTLGQQARVQVENTTSPITAPWAGQSSFPLREEYYRWKAPVAGDDLDVLLSLDETSTYTNPRDLIPGLQTPVYPDDQPLEWTKSFRGANRVWYTNLGHYDGTFDRADWKAHFVAAVRWVAEGATGS